jgi:hypothetical protein
MSRPRASPWDSPVTEPTVADDRDLVPKAELLPEEWLDALAEASRRRAEYDGASEPRAHRGGGCRRVALLLFLFFLMFFVVGPLLIGGSFLRFFF